MKTLKNAVTGLGLVLVGASSAFAQAQVFEVSSPQLVYITTDDHGNEDIIVPDDQESALSDFLQTLRTEFTIGGGVNTLQGAFGSFGIMITPDASGKRIRNGAVIKLQVSEGGAMASVGFLSRQNISHTPIPGFSFSATLDFYRSWAEQISTVSSHQVMSGQNFLGASLGAKLLIFQFTAGVLKHVGGSQPDLGWIPHVGLGFGI